MTGMRSWIVAMISFAGQVTTAKVLTSSPVSRLRHFSQIAATANGEPVDSLADQRNDAIHSPYLMSTGADGTALQEPQKT